jgi:uncharacterized small protein (DUF1192 family)
VVCKPNERSGRMSEKTDQLASGLDAIRQQFDTLSVEEVQQQAAVLVDIVRGMSVDELEQSIATLRDASTDAQGRLRATEQKRDAVTGVGRMARNRLDTLQRADAQRGVQ